PGQLGELALGVVGPELLPVFLGVQPLDLPVVAALLLGPVVRLITSLFSFGILGTGFGAFRLASALGRDSGCGLLFGLLGGNLNWLQRFRASRFVRVGHGNPLLRWPA